MKKMMIILLISCGQWALAQSLVPATSEDLGDFDRQIQEAQQNQPKAKAPEIEKKVKAENPKAKTNFGSLVSQEAKKLKDSSPNQRGGMGQFVREQRQQSELKTPSASQGQGSAASSNKNPARENSSNAPGQSGKNKK